MALPAILCAGLLVGCGAEPPAEEHVRVLAQTVKMAEFASATSITGDIQARVQADQSFRVGGKIVERLVDVGDHVAAGQVLARLDPQDQRSNVENAQAAVAAQQAQSKLADLNYQRQKALLPKGYTSQSEYDQALASVRSAQSSLKAAQAQLANARDLLSYTELRASDAGVITARQAEVGQVVQATVPIFTLARDGERATRCSTSTSRCSATMSTASGSPSACSASRKSPPAARSARSPPRWTSAAVR